MHPRGVHEFSQQWRRLILNNSFLYTVNTYRGHRPHERDDTAERARNGCATLSTHVVDTACRSGMIQRSVLEMAAASREGQSDGPRWVMQMAALGLTIWTVPAASALLGSQLAVKLNNALQFGFVHGASRLRDDATTYSHFFLVPRLTSGGRRHRPGGHVVVSRPPAGCFLISFRFIGHL